MESERSTMLPCSANNFGVPSAKVRSIHGDDAVVDGHGMGRVRLGDGQVEKRPSGKEEAWGGVETMMNNYWILEERNRATPKIKHPNIQTGNLFS